MRYVLAPGVSYCRVGQSHVFLDELQDRYFLLGGDSRVAFDALVADQPVAAHRIRALEDAGIVHRGPKGSLAAARIEVPQRSLLDELDLRAATPPYRLAGVWAAFLRARRLQRAKPFGAILQQWRMRKPPAAPRGKLGQARTLARAADFQRLRRWVPFAPVCLTDSLALYDYLHARGCAASIVIGVRLSPFAAHCWVQTPGALLNDVHDNVACYVPVSRI